jgi:phage gp36-like protein
MSGWLFSRLVSHSATERVDRHQLRAVLDEGTAVMDGYWPGRQQLRQPPDPIPEPRIAVKRASRGA